MNASHKGKIRISDQFTVGTAKARPGEVVRGIIKVGEYPDGTPIESPVMIASGKRTGPVLWVQTLVHGQEIGGVLGVHGFLASPLVTGISGSVVFNLVTNPLAFRDGRRGSLRDGADLNRSYPGAQQKSISEQVAYAAFEAATQCADAVLDLHSGGDDLVCCHHALYAGLTSVDLALASGAPRLWKAPDGSFSNAAFTAFDHAGIPAALIESGGGGAVSQADVINYAQAIAGACSWLGMSDAPAQALTPVSTGTDFVELRSVCGGIFTASLDAGEEVRSGQPIGTVVDIFGDPKDIVKCDFSRGWIAAIRRSPSPVYAGDLLAEVISHD